MNTSKKDFLNSLDLIDPNMEKHVPYALQDLWELGSMPKYIIKLIEKNIEPSTIENIIDFGCGKGAVLIKLSQRIDFYGLGIDIVPEFIDSANKYAIEHSLIDKVKFEIGDLKAYLPKAKNYDIAIYGYDSTLLGNINQTLLQLSQCIKDKGYIVLEIAFTLDSKNRIQDIPSEKELNGQLSESQLKLVDHVFWDINKIKKINRSNNKFIGKRIQELKTLYPHKSKIFETYMTNQLEESKRIENDMICSSWLLKK